jgi:hypothetical protein
LSAILLLIFFWPPRSIGSAAEAEDDLETEPQIVT